MLARLTPLHPFLRRIGQVGFTLWGATLVTFAIAYLIPADVARMVAGDAASEEVVAKVAAELGLDQPLWRQYFVFLGDVLSGDLGVSIRTGQPVLDDLTRVAPATFELALAAFVLVVVIGVGAGSVAARARGRWPDLVVRAYGALGVSSPTFWVGLILVAIFADALGWAPTGGRLGGTILDPPQITGFLLLDGLLTGRLDVAKSAAEHLVLPAITLALGPAASIARLTRANLIEVYGQDYIKRARASGLPEGFVFRHYALPNALVPLITVLGVLLADLLVGAVITEIIFSWPGLGNYTVEAIAGLDFPAILGFTLISAFAYALANLTVDIVNNIVDPRGASAP